MMMMKMNCEQLNRYDIHVDYYDYPFSIKNSSVFMLHQPFMQWHIFARIFVFSLYFCWRLLVKKNFLTTILELPPFLSYLIIFFFFLEKVQTFSFASLVSSLNLASIIKNKKKNSIKFTYRLRLNKWKWMSVDVLTLDIRIDPHLSIERI